MNPLLTLATAATSRSPALLAASRLTVSVTTATGPDVDSGAVVVAVFVWAVAIDPPMHINPLTRPAADQARTRQRCRQSIAANTFLDRGRH